MTNNKPSQVISKICAPLYGSLNEYRLSRTWENVSQTLR